MGRNIRPTHHSKRFDTLILNSKSNIRLVAKKSRAILKGDRKMTDEEMAEEYLQEKLEERKDKFVFELPEVYIANVKQAFLAGLKAGRPQWHNVKDGNPDNDNDILCQIEKDWVEVGYYHTKLKRYYTIDGQDINVIRWQEIVFPKEP